MHRRRIRSSPNASIRTFLGRPAIGAALLTGALPDHLPAHQDKEGLSKKEIIRCLKRYIARELYKVLTRPKTPAPQANDLRLAS